MKTSKVKFFFQSYEDILLLTYNGPVLSVTTLNRLRVEGRQFLKTELPHSNEGGDSGLQHFQSDFGPQHFSFM